MKPAVCSRDMDLGPRRSEAGGGLSTPSSAQVRVLGP